METVITEVESPYRVVEHGRGGRPGPGCRSGLVWELEEGPTTTVTLTFWTAPALRIDRIREIGRDTVVAPALEQGPAADA